MFSLLTSASSPDGFPKSVATVDTLVLEAQRKGVSSLFIFFLVMDNMFGS